MTDWQISTPPEVTKVTPVDEVPSPFTVAVIIDPPAEAIPEESEMGTGVNVIPVVVN